MSVASFKVSEPRHPSRRHTRALILLLVATAATAVLVRSVLDHLIESALHELESEMNVEASYSNSRLYLTGLTLHDVRIALAPDPATHRALGIIASDRVDLRPSVSGVLRGHRGFPWTLTAALYAGTVTLTVDARENAWQASIEWTDIDLTGPATLLDAGQISGTSDGRLLLTTREDDRSPRLIDGSWEIAAREIECARFHAGSLPLPPVVVSDFYTTGSWTGRQVTVARLGATGSFGEVALAGKIVIRTPFERSALGMRLTHTWPAEIDPALGILIRMLLGSGVKGHPGQYRVTGTISAPAITLTAPP